MTWTIQRLNGLGFAAIALLIFGFGGWATQTTLSGAIIASGQVEVDQNRQVVQHPDGGVVAAILVAEGDHVTKGQTLIQFDDTLLASERVIIEGQLYELMARRARFVAERDGKDRVEFSDELLDAGVANPEIEDILMGQQRLFDARKLGLRQSIEQMHKRKDQTQNQVTGLRAQHDALKIQSVLLDQELSAQQALLDRGLTQTGRVLTLRRQSAELMGKLGQITASMAEAEGKATEIQLEILRLQSKHREDAISQLRDLEVRESAAAEKRRNLVERLDRMHVRAPVDGVVYDMVVFAERSVVQPAEPILQLVPQDQPLVVAARIDPMHVDQVHVGQKALLRITTFDQRTTPELLGWVAQISADTFQDQKTGVSYYKAEVALNTGELDKLPDGKFLIPGMPVESFLRTEDRSPLAYLIKPLSDYFAKALRES